MAYSGILPIQAPVLDRLGDMLLMDICTAVNKKGPIINRPAAVMLFGDETCSCLLQLELPN